jgi:hypothetical protein
VEEEWGRRRRFDSRTGEEFESYYMACPQRRSWWKLFSTHTRVVRVDFTPERKKEQAG